MDTCGDSHRPFAGIVTIDNTGGKNTVFGKKQEYAKDLQERINSAESQIGLLQEKISQVDRQTQQILPCFESQIVAQSEMDKDLTEIVNHAYDTIAANDENGQALEQLAIEFTNMRSRMEEEEKETHKLQESISKQKGQVKTAVERSQACTEPMEQMRQLHEKITDSAQRMRSQITQMQHFSKDMSVLSLNSAIEAGRMGESGRQFIGAAEDVRQLSVAYEHAADAASKQLGELEGRIGQLESQLAALTKAHKDSSQSVAQISKSAAESDEIWKRNQMQAYVKKLAALTDQIKKISQSHDIIHVLQHQTLDQIEHIGESFVEEQEARKELERIFDQIVSCIHA